MAKSSVSHRSVATFTTTDNPKPGRHSAPKKVASGVGSVKSGAKVIAARRPHSKALHRNPGYVPPIVPAFGGSNKPHQR